MELITEPIDSSVSCIEHPLHTGVTTEAPPELVIRVQRGWSLFPARELWRYRELLGMLALRDIQVRYKQTLLGIAWAVLQPALMMVVFTVVFGRLARLPTGSVPYPVFAYAGLLPWTFFATSIATAATSIISSEQLVSKVYFPRMIIPLAAVGAALVDFLVALTLLLILMVSYGITPSANLFVAPCVVGLLTLAGMGVGTVLAALTVAYRDFRYVVPFLVQLWMFATPSVYMQVAPRGDEATLASAVWLLNPMTSLIASFRTACLGGTFEWVSLAGSAVTILIVFVAASVYFRRVESRFADII
jgi:lipopolysaccharide transport system permease protein